MLVRIVLIDDRCFAGRSITNVAKVEALKAFERPEVRVCLLDLKLAARGL
jgi:pyrimidine operon attenuation protein/uracil phosphoribosyltransferase